MEKITFSRNSSQVKSGHLHSCTILLCQVHTDSLCGLCTDSGSNVWGERVCYVSWHTRKSGNVEMFS